MVSYRNKVGANGSFLFRLCGQGTGKSPEKPALAVLVSSRANSSPYLALHRTLPIFHVCEFGKHEVPNAKRSEGVAAAAAAAAAA